MHTVLAASKQVGTPMFFGVVIITVVYIPILALTGIEGKMFHPMALTVMLALAGALMLALTLMPVLCSFVLRGTDSRGRQFHYPRSERNLRAKLKARSCAALDRGARRDCCLRRLDLAVQAPRRGIRAEAR